MPTAKIATCCYCGTRAALVLKGESRHELSCATCGAPLHELKGLKTADSVRASGRARPETRRTAVRLPYSPVRDSKKPKKRRKTLGRRLMSEALELFDDIFD